MYYHLSRDTSAELRRDGDRVGGDGIIPMFYEAGLLWMAILLLWVFS